MSDDFDDPAVPAPATRPVRESRIANTPDRSPPASAEAEEHVIACCLLDEGPTLARARESGLTPESFYFPANRLIFEIMLAMPTAPALDTLVAELQSRRALDSIGGMPYLMQVVGPIPTTAHASYFIQKVRELQQKRTLLSEAASLIDQIHAGIAVADLPAVSVAAPATKPHPQHPPSFFVIPTATDASVLLGNRYLNRGDGIILSGPSGMGKSSMQMQMAACWALGIPFHGIGANGPLRSLIIQSEDSDGDIAEVWASIIHAMRLNTEQRLELDARVRIVTDRVNRGIRFLSALKSHLAGFTPDLVWLNPLQAFIDGDVTESRDLGAFLREGLNGLNSDSKFGYIIIHHTTKPATGKDRSERLWHEVMYDMAGGAELINWARAIISLRPGTGEGEFRLVLAKRGRRAGVVRQVEQGAGNRLEPVTTIGLKHSTERLPSGVPVIFWEPAELHDQAPAEPDNLGGRKAKFSFLDYANVFPAKNSPGLTLNELHRILEVNKPIAKPTLHHALKRWEEEGDVEILRPQGHPMRYRKGL